MPIATANVRTPGRARVSPAAHMESVRARYSVSFPWRISRGNCSVIDVATASAANPRRSVLFHREISPNRTAAPTEAAATMARTRTRTEVGNPSMPAPSDLATRDRSLVARSISAVLPDELDTAPYVQDHRPSPAQALPAVVVPSVVEPAQVVPTQVVPTQVVPPVVVPTQVRPGKALPVGAAPAVIRPSQVRPGRNAPRRVGPAQVRQLAAHQTRALPAELSPVVAERVDLAGQRVESLVRVCRAQAVRREVDAHVE